jgi:hypothetical protein
MRFPTAIVVGLCFVSAVQAEDLSGNKLFEYCSGGAGGFDAGVCHGYIRAMADAFRPGCAPKGVTYGQIKDVVIKHFRDNPQSRHQNALPLIGEAMERAWPCPVQR